MLKFFPFLIIISGFVSQTKAQCNADFNLGSDTSFCEGNTLTLDAGNGYDSYEWQDNSSAQTYVVSSTGTYSCTTSSIDYNTNLVSNGDFEQGNTSFTSDYTYYPIDDVTGPNAVYGVINNPNTWFNPFSPCPDHTTGSGNMMVIDGTTTNGGNESIWCQTVNVSPNTNYSFRYWSQSVTGAPYANIQTQINSVVLGATLAPNFVCGWEETDYSWNSGTNTTAQICLYDLEFSGNGNDFTIDDLGLYPICEYTDEIIITVVAADTIDETETICQGDSILLGGAMQYTAGVYYDNIDNTACLEIKRTTLSISPTPVALVPNDMVLNIGDVIEIEAGSTIIGTTYEWTSSEGLLEMNPSFFTSPIISTEYYLTVTRNSCTDTDTFKITIFEEGKEIFLPTAFSPNNDGVNDVFQVINDEEFSDIQMSIYNRWGEQVFFSSENNPAWDGKFKNVEQNLGLYIYYIKAKSKNTSEEISVMGNLSIIR